MNKLLKLTGVSILAIMTATGANAAGYTCEELIEYTSCNNGYTLSGRQCVKITTCDAGTYSTPSCPDGYAFASDWYWADEEGWCSFGGGGANCEGESYGMGCLLEVRDDEEGPADNLIPVEYTCASCPDTGLVSPSNTPILATSSAGATSIVECYVPSGIDIKGEHGIYRFKSNCGIDWWVAGFQDESDCDKLADSDTATWYYDSEFGACRTDEFTSLLTQAECEAITDAEWTTDGVCQCNKDGCGQWFLTTKGLECGSGC